MRRVYFGSHNIEIRAAVCELVVKTCPAFVKSPECTKKVWMECEMSQKRQDSKIFGKFLMELKLKFKQYANGRDFFLQKFAIQKEYVVILIF